MFSKSKMKSLNAVDLFLLLIFIILVNGVLFFIGQSLHTNTILYTVLMLSVIVFTTLAASIAIFQFVKLKYVQSVKDSIMEDFDKYKNKLENKVIETNGRIFSFETNYSKKLKKIMRDYNIKCKEIDNIKKELDIKLIELDRKSAGLEIEFCNMKAENIKSKAEINIKEIKALYDRIIELNGTYPGISTEESLKLIYLYLSGTEGIG